MTLHTQCPDADSCEQFYDERYARGYMHEWPARKLERVRQLIAQLGLPGSGTAVDWGCGNGVFTAILRGCLPKWRILGLEISRNAIANARHLVTGCEFQHLDDAGVKPDSVDFVFTHHVLEHVVDLEQALASMAALVKPGGRMLHILPCGNPGSFEHELCRLRADGIDSTRGGRFFYEDEGHLRRLTTDELVSLASRSSFDLVGSCYSHHQFEAIDWLTGNGVKFVLNLCNPGRAVDGMAAGRLKQLRRRLGPMAVVKSVARNRSTLAKPAVVLAQLLAAKWAAAADREWQKMQSHLNGSEMYLAFQKRR